MPWDDSTRASYAADQSVPKTNLDQLLERDELLGAVPFQVAFGEQTESSSSYITQVTFNVRVPDFVIAGWFLYAKIFRKVDAGSGGAVRLRNNTDGINGVTEETGISDTTYAFGTEVKVQIDAGPHVIVDIAVQSLNSDANNTLVRNGETGIDHLNFWWGES